jgi:hypothetical protein
VTLATSEILGENNPMTRIVCEKCNGRGSYMYDENHLKPCEMCCDHSEGWWRLEERYGDDNGKYACKRGCGTLMIAPPSEVITAQA